MLAGPVEAIDDDTTALVTAADDVGLDEELEELRVDEAVEDGDGDEAVEL